MLEKVNSLDEANTMAQSLIGLEVTLPWKGHGSTIFLELGELSPPKSKRGNRDLGESHISIDWDWRIELGDIVKFGSSLEGSEIERGLRTLQGVKVCSLSIQGRIPEIVVEFSSGHILRSMVMANGGPEWTLKLDHQRYLYSHCGSLVVDSGTEPVGHTDHEAAVNELEDAAVDRWGKPSSGSAIGSCSNCLSFVTLNGGLSFCSYGLCMGPKSPFDGRVVHDESGCNVFTRNEDA